MIYTFEATVTILRNGEDDVHDAKCTFVIYQEDHGEKLETWPYLEAWLEQWYTRVEVDRSTICKICEQEADELIAKKVAGSGAIAVIQ